MIFKIACMAAACCRDCAAVNGHCAADSIASIDIPAKVSYFTGNISSGCTDCAAVDGHRAADSITRISFFAKGANRITDTSGCRDGSAVNGYRTLNTCCRFLAGGCNFTAIDVHNTVSRIRSSDADTCCTILAATCIYGTTINVYSSATFF